MQIPEHDIGLPTADEANDVSVHLAAEEGHGPAGTETASGNVGRADAELWERGG